MQLTEYPKTQQLFKKYVDIQIEQLIEQSEDLANRYISERDEILSKRSKFMKSKTEVIRMIQFLDKLLAVPEQYRQEVQEFRGMGDQQLQKTKKEYQQLLALYEGQQQESQGQIKVKQQKQIEQSINDDSPNELTMESEQILTNARPGLITRQKIVSMSLKSLEVFTCLIVCIAVIYRLFLY